MTPYLRILFKPRQAIREIIDTDPSYQVLWGALAIGFAFNLNQIFLRYGLIGDYQNFQDLVKACLWAGVLKGYGIHYLLFGAVVYALGKKLESRSSIEEVRAALVWSMLPSLLAAGLVLSVCFHLGFESLRPPPREKQIAGLSLPIQLMEYTTLRCLQPANVFVVKNVVQSDGLDLPLRGKVEASSPYFCSALAILLAGIWSMILLPITLSEAMKLSLSKATLICAGSSFAIFVLYSVVFMAPKIAVILWLAALFWFWGKDNR